MTNTSSHSRASFFELCRNFGRKMLLTVFKKEYQKSMHTRGPSIDTRYLEYPFVLRNLELEKGRKILDVGCVGTPFPLILASLGYQTYGIDIREWSGKLQYPNFHFIKEDMRRTSFPDEFFERITAVSTIEHIGLSGRYGSDEDLDGDKKAVKEMRRILKRGGKIFITVPYGEAKIIRPFHRVYDQKMLQELLHGLRIEKEEYYIKKNNSWLSASKSEAEKVKSTEVERTKAFACLKISKQEE